MAAGRIHKILPFLLIVIFLILPLSPVACGEHKPRVLVPYSRSEYGQLSGGADPLRSYTTTLKETGMTPVPCSPSARASLDDADGLLLPGGYDVDPSFYGEKEICTIEGVDREFDQYELELLRQAWEMDMPILAICRGEQILNVSREGTLYQDLPSQRSSAGLVNHRSAIGGVIKYHVISIEAGSLLSTILGARSKIVNSTHHQAVKNIGSGLKVTALGPDGVVEAIEAPSRTFCLGVQFHPEASREWDRTFHRIFVRFRDEARKYHEHRKDRVDSILPLQDLQYMRPLQAHPAMEAEEKSSR